MSDPAVKGLIDHKWIDNDFRVLKDALDHGRTSDVAGLLETLEARLREHMDEEDALLSSSSDFDRDEAQALREEHDGFRTTLADLVARARSGSLVPKDIHELKLRFSLHESREETGFYRWRASQK